MFSPNGLAPQEQLCGTNNGVAVCNEPHEQADHAVIQDNLWWCCGCLGR